MESPVQSASEPFRPRQNDWFRGTIGKGGLFGPRPQPEEERPAGGGYGAPLVTPGRDVSRRTWNFKPFCSSLTRPREGRDVCVCVAVRRR